MSVPMYEPDQTGGDVDMYTPEDQKGGDIDIYVPEKPQSGGLFVPPTRRGAFGLHQQSGGGIKRLGRRVLTMLKQNGEKVLEQAGEKALETGTEAAKQVARKVIAGKTLKDAVAEEKDNVITTTKRQAKNALGPAPKKKKRPAQRKKKTAQKKKRKPRVNNNYDMGMFE